MQPHAKAASRPPPTGTVSPFHDPGQQEKEPHMMRRFFTATPFGASLLMRPHRHERAEVCF